MVSDTVLTALISGTSGIIITFLTMYFRAKAVTSKSMGKPKDRMDLIFEGYEKLIKELQSDIDRKAQVIDHFEKLADKYREDIRTSETMITSLRDQIETLEDEIEKLTKELVESQSARDELKRQLEKMKIDFNKGVEPVKA